MSTIIYIAFCLPVVVPAEQAGAFNITLNYVLSVNYMNNSSIPSTGPPSGPTPRRRNPNTMNGPTRSTEPPPYPFPRRRQDLLEGPAPGCKIRYGAPPPLGMMPRRLYASKIGDCSPREEEEEVESKIRYGALPLLGMMPRRRNPSTFGVPPVEVEEEEKEISNVHYGTPPAGPVARRLNPRTLYAPMMHYGIPPPGRYPRRRNPLKLNTPSVPRLHSGIPPVGRYPRRLDPVKLAGSPPRRCTLPPSRLRLRPRPRTRRTSRFALHRRGYTSNSDNTRA